MEKEEQVCNMEKGYKVNGGGGTRFVKVTAVEVEVMAAEV